MPKRVETRDDKRRLHVSLVAIPEVMASTLTGLYDVFNSLPLLASFAGAPPNAVDFKVEIVALAKGVMNTASGIRLNAHKSIEEVRTSDIAIIPSVLVERGEWRQGRYPKLVQWLLSLHEQGAQLCSSCSGVLLLAETGLLNERDATIHWIYAQTFRRNFPRVRLRQEKALVVSGESHGFVMSGASTSWHDLALYLIAQRIGPTAAQSVAKFFAIQGHPEDLSPYMVFEPATDHGDAAIQSAQEWLGQHFSVGNPIEQAVKRSGIPGRTFKRRFKIVTGLAPIDYVQRLRVEEAKRRLERTTAPVDEIGWKVGYEDSAFFRRLFKRTTGITAGAYRRKFQVPGGIPAKK
ncbi:MAG TPA: helix-turn-helix domain-containing protein [Candidatus Limnocylindria bacterium]|nr:helix-turn-helix domain-containing protein [Candidatus Limnocylindria bacterium]